MIKIFDKIFRIPDHFDEEKNRIAKFLQITNLLVLLAVVVICIISYFTDWPLTFYTTLIAMAIILVCIALNKKKYLKLSSVVLMMTILISVSFEATIGDGLHDIGMVFFPIFIILASLLFGLKGYIIYNITILLSLFLIVWFRIVFSFEEKYGTDHLVEILVIWSVLIIEAILIKIITNWFLETLRKVSLNEVRYKSIYENIQDVYFENSMDGKIIEITPSIEKFSILKREDMLGMDMNNFYKNPNEREKVIYQLMNNGELRNYETQLVDINGKVFDVILNIIIIKDKNGNPIKTAGSIHDNTFVKKLQTQLIQSQKLEATGTLAGGIAHDFNNILSAIFGYVQILQRKFQTQDELQDYLNKILAASSRAKDLVAQILAFSRQSKTEKIPIELNHIINESYKFLRASIPSTIEIKNNIISEKGMIQGNETQIQQIILNLCTNSYHAVDISKGIIEISLENVELSDRDLTGDPSLKAGEYIKISVSDNGSGMDKKVLERIFDPYFTTKGQGEGTGLGLSTVLGIVKEHGGLINVYSERNVGTTINIYFPAIHPIENVPVAYENAIEGGTESILLIDDEMLIVENTTEILESFGYTVNSFTKPEIALDFFKDNYNSIDLIITDMTMPKLSGLQFAEAAKIIKPEIPIIISTGYSKELSQVSSGLLNNIEIINKPFLIHELARLIRNILVNENSKIASEL